MGELVRKITTEDCEEGSWGERISAVRSAWVCRQSLLWELAVTLCTLNPALDPKWHFKGHMAHGKLCVPQDVGLGFGGTWSVLWRLSSALFCTMEQKLFNNRGQILPCTAGASRCFKKVNSSATNGTSLRNNSRISSSTKKWKKITHFLSSFR